MRCGIVTSESSSKLGLLSGGHPLSLFDMLLATWVGGFRNSMFPMWFALLSGFFVFFDMGLSILFFVFTFFECFDLFVIGRVSSPIHVLVLMFQVKKEKTH